MAEALFGITSGTTDTVMNIVDRCASLGQPCTAETLVANGIGRTKVGDVLAYLVRNGVLAYTQKGSRQTVMWKEYTRP